MTDDRRIAPRSDPPGDAPRPRAGGAPEPSASPSPTAAQRGRSHDPRPRPRASPRARASGSGHACGADGDDDGNFIRARSRSTMRRARRSIGAWLWPSLARFCSVALAWAYFGRIASYTSAPGKIQATGRTKVRRGPGRWARSSTILVARRRVGRGRRGSGRARSDRRLGGAHHR